MTQAQVARELKITPNTVRVIEKRALLKCYYFCWMRDIRPEDLLTRFDSWELDVGE